MVTAGNRKAFRRADMHTGYTHSLRGFAYRERDMAYRRTPQGACGQYITKKIKGSGLIRRLSVCQRCFRFIDQRFDLLLLVIGLFG